MTGRRLLLLPLALLPALGLAFFGGVLPAPRSAAAGSYSDAAWAEALAAQAQDSKVAALKAVRRYTAQLSSAQPNGPAERESFWLNAYDALALQTLLSTGGPAGKVRRALWPHAVAGHWLTLDAIERRLRATGDPRIYFALTLSGHGAPPLPEAPFRRLTLDRQLNDAARRYLADAHHVRLREKTLHLTPLLGGELKAMAERDVSQTLIQLVWTFLPRECEGYPGCVTRAELDRVCGPHLDACPVRFDVSPSARSR